MTKQTVFVAMSEQALVKEIKSIATVGARLNTRICAIWHESC